MAVLQHWFSFLVLSCCVALLMPVNADIIKKPVYPGKNATPEQLEKYMKEMRAYFNYLNRQRYGKRAEDERFYQDGVDFLE